jgi:hypothetical protein
MSFVLAGKVGRQIGSQQCRTVHRIHKLRGLQKLFKTDFQVSIAIPRNLNMLIKLLISRLTDIESTKSRDVIQFHYTTWPDFGVPSSPIAFLQFLKQVRDSGALDEDVGPPVIHCR